MNNTIIRIFGKDNKLIGLMYNYETIKVNSDKEEDIIKAMKELELLNPNIMSNYKEYEKKDLFSDLDFSSSKEEVMLVADRSLEQKNPKKENGLSPEAIAAREAEKAIQEGVVENEQEEDPSMWNLKVAQRARRILAGGVAAVLLVTGIIHIKNRINKNDTGIVQTDKTLENLINSLKEGYQKDTFKTIDEAQKAFNLEASPTISIPEDNGAQLFLNSDEMVALYTYSNADFYAKDTFKEIFGNSGLMDESYITENYANAGRVLNNYYKLSTEPSGLSKLFKNEKEVAIFEEFENLVIENNKNSNNKAQIQSKLLDIYMSGKIDDIKSQYPGVASFIATHMVPALYSDGVISKEQYQSIIEINETVTCNDLKEYIKEIEEECKTSVEDTSLIPEVMLALDAENIKVESRELNWEARAGVTQTSANTKKDGVPSKSKTSSTSSIIGTGESAREEAVKEFGEEEVKEAESKADEEFHEEYDVKNQQQKVYAQGYEAIYNEVFRDSTYKAFSGKTVTIAEYESLIQTKLKAYTGVHKEYYEQGLRDGAANALNDGMAKGIEQKKIAETRIIDNTTVVEEVNPETPEKYPDINISGINTVTGTVIKR